MSDEPEMKHPMVMEEGKASDEPMTMRPSWVNERPPVGQGVDPDLPGNASDTVGATPADPTQSPTHTDPLLDSGPDPIKETTPGGYVPSHGSSGDEGSPKPADVASKP